MKSLDKFVHIVAILLFLLEAGRWMLTDVEPTTLSAVIYCIFGAVWVAKSYFEKSYTKTE